MIDADALLDDLRIARSGESKRPIIWPMTPVFTRTSAARVSRVRTCTTPRCSNGELIANGNTNAHHVAGATCQVVLQVRSADAANARHGMLIDQDEVLSASNRQAQCICDPAH